MKKYILKFIPYSVVMNLKYIKQYFISFLYSGSKFNCPNCNGSFRKMFYCGQNEDILTKLEVIGSGIRKNCLCPRCYSIDRERLIYLFLSQKTNIFSEKTRLLHIAPRPSLRKIFNKSKNIEYFKGDKFEEGYHYSKDVIELDITKLKFENDFFDIIICNHVLEHIPDDLQAINELYRVLKPGGFAILQVPLSLKLEKTYEVKTDTAQERKKLFGQSDHYRIYAKDFINKLESCNFNVNLYNPNDLDWNLDTEKYGLNNLEDLIVANK